MLADTEANYKQQQQSLTAAFCAEYGSALLGASAGGSQMDAAAAADAVAAAASAGVADRLVWAPRAVPRKFGRVLPGEVEACREVAARHGLLLDPIWHLAAWEEACRLAAGGAPAHDGSGGSGSGSGAAAAAGAAAEAAPLLDSGDAGTEVVALLHTGGVLGLCGLAQRFPDQF